MQLKVLKLHFPAKLQQDAGNINGGIKKDRPQKDGPKEAFFSCHYCPDRNGSKR